MARKVIEVIAVEYRREIARVPETSPMEETIARFMPPMRRPTACKVVVEKHYDPNTASHPLHGRLVYAWRKNARFDNKVGLDQGESLRETQKRLRDEALADEYRLFQDVIETVTRKHNGRTPRELSGFVGNLKARSAAGVPTNPTIEAEEELDRRHRFVELIARAEISRVATGRAPGFLGFGLDPVHLVLDHVVAEVVELMELNPKEVRKLLSTTSTSRRSDRSWFERTLEQEIANAKQMADAEIDRLEEEAEVWEYKLSRPRGGNDAIQDRLLKANQGRGRSSPRTGYRRKWCRCSFASWKGSTHCRKQWELRPRGIR